MNKIILISGDLASGKSTLSKKLSTRYNILCINKDNIKEILGDNFGFRNREENLKLSVCTFDLFKYITQMNILSKSNIIIESNFRNHELDYFYNLDCDYKIYTIVLKSDICILHKRFLNRINNENRHIVHKAVDFSNYLDFEKQIISDRNRNYQNEFVIDTTSFDNINEDLFKQIDKYLEMTNINKL